MEGPARSKFMRIVNAIKLVFTRNVIRRLIDDDGW